MFKLKSIAIICLGIFLFACNNNQSAVKNIPVIPDSAYLSINFPKFKSIKLLYLDSAVYPKFDIKEIDSLVKLKILDGNFQFFTFLDSLGRPLSKHYDAVVLKQDEQTELVRSLGKYYAKDDPGPPKCGAQYRDAIVFYDSIGKPVAHIEICFGCGVFNFSRSLPIDETKCNRDSMMKKITFFFNRMGIPRRYPHI
ncbi:hypothetical protein [Ferruginibacter sp.]